MAQHSSIGASPGAVQGALDGFARSVATFALVVAMVAIGLLTSGGASSLLLPLSTGMESTWLRPSGAAVAPRALNRGRAQRTNDDGYLEGLTKALD
jgi:hypothetical protein